MIDFSIASLDELTILDQALDYRDVEGEYNPEADEIQNRIKAELDKRK